MPADKRRILMKGIAIAVPAAWARPVVESIMLPAHAESSPGGCGLPQGCYETSSGLFVLWPGGEGPEFNVERFNDPNCQDLANVISGDAVIAESLQAAEAALACADNPANTVEAFGETPSGCNFYFCD